LSSLFDYLAWRGDLDFAVTPLNPVDNIILCQLSYFPFEGIVPGPDEGKDISVRDAMDILSQKLKNDDTARKSVLMFRDDPALISALGCSRRFEKCRLSAYVNHIDTQQEVQFSALSVKIHDRSYFVAYRGTDASLVGWKEDFNMSFSEVIPAQREALEYLKNMAKRTEGNIWLGGHSKGGNLAIYAASQCGKNIQRRITAVYGNDAPGFHGDFIVSENYAAVKDRIHLYVPQASVVGMFLEHGKDHTVIRSSASGLAQHELYTWEVTHNGMVYADDLSQGSRFVDKTLRDWIANHDNARREQFIEAVYNIVRASKATSLSELENAWFQSAGRMIQALGETDEPTKSLIRKTFRELIHSARSNLETLLRN
jgi:predicted esterase